MDVIVKNGLTGNVYDKKIYGNFVPNRIYMTDDDHVVIEVELIRPQPELQEEFNKASQL